jgi:DHA1 family bicyclomycin/chloramphenicol resistance-like MFS transporter
MALGGCVGMVAARAIVRDVFSADETARTLSLLVLVMGVAPIIAPTMGGFVNNAWGWRWVFGAMGLIALVLFAVVKWLFTETKAADVKVSTQIPVIATGYWKVLKNRSFLVYALAGGLSYAGMYAYIAGSPSVFMEQFGLSSSAYGWAFAFNACGLISGSQLNRLALKRYNSSKVCKLSGLMLFITGLILAILSLIGLMNMLSTLLLTFLFLFWLGFINPNTTALGLAPFSREAGRASALLGSIQMIAGVIASWLVSFFDQGTLITMPVIMFGCALFTVLVLYFPQKAQSKNVSPPVTL